MDSQTYGKYCLAEGRGESELAELQEKANTADNERSVTRPTAL